MSLVQWWARVQDEGHDSLGAFELPLAVATFVGLAPGWLAPESWLVRVALIIEIALALLWGHRVENRRLYAVGHRRFRGTLHLRLTWLLIGWALLWASALLSLAHLRTWDQSPGWYNDPLCVAATLSVIFLALGVKARVRRWVGLGLALAIGVGLLPWVAMQEISLHLLMAFWVGGALWVSAYAGQREFERQYNENNMR